MALVPWPDEGPDLWNTCELGGIDMPGLAHVKIKLSEEVEVKKPKGGHGATLILQGYNPAKVKIIIRMWQPAQFELYQQIVVPLRPRIGSKRDRKPFDIVHPKTTMYGIKAVVIDNIEDENGDRGDFYEVTFECIEHLPPPKNVKATVKALVVGDNVIRSTQFDTPPAPAKPSATGNVP